MTSESMNGGIGTPARRLPPRKFVLGTSPFTEESFESSSTEPNYDAPVKDDSVGVEHEPGHDPFKLTDEPLDCDVAADVNCEDSHSRSEAVAMAEPTTVEEIVTHSDFVNTEQHSVAEDLSATPICEEIVVPDSGSDTVYGEEAGLGQVVLNATPLWVVTQAGPLPIGSEASSIGYMPNAEAQVSAELPVPTSDDVPTEEFASAEEFALTEELAAAEELALTEELGAAEEFALTEELGAAEQLALTEELSLSPTSEMDIFVDKEETSELDDTFSADVSLDVELEDFDNVIGPISLEEDVTEKRLRKNSAAIFATSAVIVALAIGLPVFLTQAAGWGGDASLWAGRFVPGLSADQSPTATEKPSKSTEENTPEPTPEASETPTEDAEPTETSTPEANSTKEAEIAAAARQNAPAASGNGGGAGGPAPAPPPVAPEPAPEKVPGRLLVFGGRDTSQVSVTAWFQANGDSVSGATISFSSEGNSQSCTTGGDGRCSVALPSGESSVTVSVSAPGTNQYTGARNSITL